jgi:hypothetical protein
MYRKKSDEPAIEEIARRVQRRKSISSDITELLSKYNDRSIKRLLRHNDPKVRFAVLYASVFNLNKNAGFRVCKDFLFKDPDVFNRALGAACFGKIFRNSSNKVALKLLIKVSKSEKAPWVVRYTAYTAYYEVISKNRRGVPATSPKFNKTKLIVLEKKLRNLHKDLKKGIFSDDAIIQLGNYHFLEAKKEIERCLESKDAVLRRHALMQLVLEMGLGSYRKICVRFLLKDSDEDVRGMAAACLGSMLRGSKDKKAIRLLLRVLNNKKEEALVRISAHDALYDILGVAYKSRKQLPFDDRIKENADSKLLNRLKIILEGGRL